MEPFLQDLYTELEQHQVRNALQALKRVFSLAQSELFNDTILLLGQESKLASDIRKGILTTSEQSVMQARLLNAALELTNEIRDNPEEYRQFHVVDEGIDLLSRQRDSQLLPLQMKEALYDRLAYLTEKRITCRILWIDNHPENNAQEVRTLRDVGLDVNLATSSSEAMSAIQHQHYQVIVSDRSREGNRQEGLDFHRVMMNKGKDIPTIFYVGKYDRADGLPPYVFGMTSSPTELLHLILDVIQRGK